MRGLIVAALLATLMSSLDSVLNGASSLMVNDFIKTSRKEFSEKTLLRISRGLVVLFMAIAVAWAPVILGFDTIVEYFQSFLGYVTMPVVVVLVGGIFWKRATKTAAFWTLVTVAPLGLLGFITGEILGAAPHPVPLRHRHHGAAQPDQLHRDLPEHPGTGASRDQRSRLRQAHLGRRVPAAERHTVVQELPLDSRRRAGAHRRRRGAVHLSQRRILMIFFPLPVIAGVDGTRPARHALLTAVEICAATDSPLHLVHIKLTAGMIRGRPMTPAQRERADAEGQDS